MGLRSYVLTRVLLMIPMILLLITIVFMIVRVLPGDPIMLHFEKKASEAQMAAMAHILGMDVPIIQQYFNYIVAFFRGDLGISMQDYSRVSDQVFSAFPATLELAIYAIIIAAVLGVLLGAKSAGSYNRPKDHLIRISGIVSYAIPVFFLGMIFQIVLCVGLGLFPVGGRMYPGQDPVGMNLALTEPAGGFGLGFILPSSVTLLPLLLCLIPLRESQKEAPKPRQLEMIFVVFLLSTLVYSFGAMLVPGILMAPLASTVPLVACMLYLKPKHFTVKSREWRITLEVFAASWILYTLAGGLFPILLVSYLVGLLPALIFLRFMKRSKMKPTHKDFMITFAALVMVWVLLVIVAAHFTAAGTLQVKTGLFTIDSILEGSVYKFVESFRYLFLPALTLGIVLSGVFIRLTRTNMIETLRLDYVTAARARGLRNRTVIYGYALRNAFLPVLTMIGLQFAALLGGAVLTETTFSWPGLGRYIVDRINFRDYTAIQGAVVVFGVLVMFVSLVVDLLYAYLDPRIRL